MVLAIQLLSLQYFPLIYADHFIDSNLRYEYVIEIDGTSIVSSNKPNAVRQPFNYDKLLTSNEN